MLNGWYSLPYDTKCNLNIEIRAATHSIQTYRTHQTSHGTEEMDELVRNTGRPRDPHTHIISIRT